ncbi:MAG: prolyl oligopeptidase family serine peptidase [Elusimicrobia bacterium]|nr:prolyl oligopeptidase family serine peptidase [Elusimicrobiota bacterium]
MLGVEKIDFWHKSDKRQLRAQLCKPSRLVPGRKIPLVAFDVGLQFRVWEIPLFAQIISLYGFAVVATEYNRIEIARGEIEDIVSAIRYARNSFEFVDSKTLLVGVSMGAASMLNIAAKYQKELGIAGIAALAPFADLARAYYYATAYTMTRPKDDPRVGLLKLYLKHIYAMPHIKPQEYISRSPTNFVPYIDCPVMLVHGKNDKIVPVDHSLELYYKMLYLGKDVKLRLVPGEGVHTPLLFSEQLRSLNFIGFLQSCLLTLKFLKNFR